MACLSKSDILKCRDFKLESVEVPEWGGTVNVRTMTGAARIHFEGKVKDLSELDTGLLLVVLTACDDKGKLLFSEDDIPELKEKNVEPLIAVAKASGKLNKVYASEIDAAEKN